MLGHGWIGLRLAQNLLDGEPLDLRHEGHGLGRPENRRSFKAVTEAFLAMHLGGRCEPVGDDFEGSTIAFKVGRELIPGLG